MRILDKIKMREEFTPTENTIGQFILSSGLEFTNISLDDLAERLYVSKSSIIRFCKKLGFHGHKELCVQLAKELNTFVVNNEEINPSVPYSSTDTTKVIAEKTYTLTTGALTQTFQDVDIEQLERIAKQIHRVNRIYIYTDNESFPVAKDFASKLQSIHFAVHLSSVENYQAILQDPTSIALLICYEERQDSFAQIAKILLERKIPIYYLGGPKKTYANRNATERVLVSYYEPYPKMSSIGSTMACMFILDILFGYLFQLDYDQNMAYVQENEDLYIKYANHIEEG